MNGKEGVLRECAYESSREREEGIQDLIRKNHDHSDVVALCLSAAHSSARRAFSAGAKKRGA